jgi:SAM-dependent methyltransferase
VRLSQIAGSLMRHTASGRANSKSTADTMRYGFGENWAEFVAKDFSEERVRAAQSHLLSFLKLVDLRGKSFLDIGCGSGLHSLAACRAGAERVVSFDYDKHSVRTTEKLRELVGSPSQWRVVQGSVLDRNFLGGLERADIVYSWGVLHHTGDMWRAIENAALPMRDDGVFYIALYTADAGIMRPSPQYWLNVKKSYNQAGPLRRRCMEWAYAWRVTIKNELAAGHNPFRAIRNYQSCDSPGHHRGMSFWTDVKDWLGGWPMEFAGTAETRAFCADRLGLELLNISTGEANTEYLFRKRGARNYWDEVMAAQTVEPLDGPFIHRGGHAWVAQLARHADTSDTNEQPRRSRLMLYEDGAPLGLAHALHAHIEAYGGGRYSHWNDTLIFSTSDNSDPNAPGRRYTICATGREP